MWWSLRDQWLANHLILKLEFQILLHPIHNDYLKKSHHQENYRQIQLKHKQYHLSHKLPSKETIHDFQILRDLIWRNHHLQQHTWKKEWMLQFQCLHIHQILLLYNHRRHNKHKMMYVAFVLELEVQVVRIKLYRIELEWNPKLIKIGYRISNSRLVTTVLS